MFFKPLIATTDGSLFDAIDHEEMQQLGRFPPDNAFEEQVELTRQGKLWHFPIDNEQGRLKGMTSLIDAETEILWDK